MIEEAAVFTRSLGEAAEIVTKQMYLFQDRGGRSVALRPEGTASVVRCFVENGWDKTGGLSRLYYLGPMFRAERPQHGRRRQFHQLGVEVFGSASPYQDAEVMALLMQLLKEWGVRGAVLEVNNLGCRKDRPKLVKLLTDYFTENAADLCEDCKERLKKNPIRILDCKNAKCGSASFDPQKAPSPWLCEECRHYFEKVETALSQFDVAYGLNSRLVRGLDYYSRTAFEVIHPELEGVQNALGGGGRYDELVEEMGGVATPAVGFAVGLERILMVRKAGSSGSTDGLEGPAVFVAPIGEESLQDGIRFLTQLRAAGISSVADLDGRPLKRQLEQANRLRCRWVLLRGEAERKTKVVKVKQMTSGEQTEVAEDSLVEMVKAQMGGKGA